MGVYHLMGMGLSVGAVTAPLSYLAARYERDSNDDRGFFSLSGELEQPSDMKRGGIQGLILFTTEEVYHQRVVSFDYTMNQPGQSRGKHHAGGIIPRLLRQLLHKDLMVLTEASRDSTKSMRRGEIEVHWCLYEPSRPTQTFERVAAVLHATKAGGSLGKETWINLTGGTNIINSALQLAIGLLGVSARLYYCWTEHPECVFHTVRQADLGHPEKDRFWVDLPVIYSGFNEQHRCILDLLAKQTSPPTLEKLYALLYGSACGANFPTPPVDTRQERLAWFRQAYLLPLRTQQLMTPSDSEIALVQPSASYVRV